MDSAKILEFTLAIIEPNAIKYRNFIINKIIRSGFYIVRRKITKLSADQVGRLRENKFGQDNFMANIIRLSEGPMEVLCLAKENAIFDFNALFSADRLSEWKNVDFYLSAYGFDDFEAIQAGIHGSKNIADARCEINFFFPNFIIDKITRQEAFKLFHDTILMNTLMDGLVQLCRRQPHEPVFWLSQWLLKNNPLASTIQLSDDLDHDKHQSEIEPKKSDSDVSTSSKSLSSVETNSSSSRQNLKVLGANQCCKRLVSQCDRKSTQDDNKNICPICNKIIKFNVSSSIETIESNNSFRPKDNFESKTKISCSCSDCTCKAFK